MVVIIVGTSLKSINNLLAGNLAISESLETPFDAV
jgi:hypothetical protein